MKRATCQILNGLLVWSLVVVAAGGPTHSQFSPRQQSKSAVETVPQKNSFINYEGIRFTVDPSLASEVRSEIIPATTSGKPCDIVPEHPAFTLVGYLPSREVPDNDPHIRAFQLTAFREATSIASKEYAKSVIYPPNPPDWTTYFDEEVRVLKELLAKRPKQQDLKTFILRVRNRSLANMGGGYPQMPFLPMWEATQAFVSHLRYVNFKNGKGVLFLTQWNTETSQITNQGLEYAFQGITDDGRYYVYAEFWVAAPFLPTDSEPDVVSWNEKNYLLLHRSKKYQRYLRPVWEKLEALPEDQFQPNLKLLEELVESLQIDP